MKQLFSPSKDWANHPNSPSNNRSKKLGVSGFCRQRCVKKIPKWSSCSTLVGNVGSLRFYCQRNPPVGPQIGRKGNKTWNQTSIFGGFMMVSGRVYHRFCEGMWDSSTKPTVCRFQPLVFTGILKLWAFSNISQQISESKDPKSPKKTHPKTMIFMVWDQGVVSKRPQIWRANFTGVGGSHPILDEIVCRFTLSKLNSEFTPEKLPGPNRKKVVLQASFFRGELLNFAGGIE